MPTTSLSQPSTTQSPRRRKRSESGPTIPPFAPRIDVRATPPREAPAQDSLVAGNNSPRSVVATQLEELKLHNSVPPLEFGASGEDGAKSRKRMRRTSEETGTIQSSLTEGFADIGQRSEESLDPTSGRLGVKIVSRPRSLTPPAIEIPETPHQSATAQEDMSTATPPRITSPPSPTLKPKPIPAPRRIASPPPPLAQSDAIATFNTSNEPESQTSSSSDTPDPASLTWQDSEITGHLVNPGDDPDDDGYGINGIGFKPTPATAYARSQKRKQQVMEWRAREAREARQKRIERRLRGVVQSKEDKEVDSGDGGAKRAVRFV